MDASTLQETFSRAVVAGCLAVSVPLALAGLALLARRTVRWSARTVRKVGLATFLALAGLGVGAMLEGTPTNEGKSDAARRLEGDAETNRLAGAGMVFGAGDGDSTQSRGGAEDGVGVSSADGMSNPSSALCDSASLREEDAPSVRPLADADYAAGFALARIGTGEAWDFAPPPGAAVSDDWTRFGAARDWFRASWHVDDGAWGAGFAFPFGTNVLGALTVFSHGTVRPDMADASSFISPLDADLGIVPESNWPLLPFNAGPADRRDDGPYRLDGGIEPSQFWHCLTPSNTFVMTWRNVLLGRDPASPVSFQAELFGNGDVVFRYDLSRLAADPVTNVVVGMSNAGGGRTFASLARSTTSLRWARLDGLLADDPDPDGDGVPTADEVFTYFTDPYCADTDMDGLSDYDEVNVHHTDPLDPHSVSASLCDGFAVKLGGVDPFSFPEGSTNTVLEHLFYTGTTNGPFSYPVATAGTAVLKVSVSGSGAGELVVGDQVVPLLAGPSGNARSAGAPANARELMVSVGQGVVKRLWLRGAADLALDTDSEDFCIGVRPTVLRPVGWCAFPFTRAEEPCIHDLSAKRVRVSLDPGPEIQGLTCDWLATTAVEVEPEPPLAARLTGRFARAETTPLAYRLGHPHHLSGRTDYVQTARYCPAAAPVPESVWSDGPSSVEDREDLFEERCICWVGCTGCDCPCHGPGCELERPQDDPDRCPDHDCPFDDCRQLHLGDYAAATNRPHMLADAIPAQSYAAGRNAVPGMTNREMSGQFKDSVRAGILFDDEDDRKWVHSFFLRVPFSVVHDLFRDFVDQLPKNGDGR